LVRLSNQNNRRVLQWLETIITAESAFITKAQKLWGVAGVTPDQALSIETIGAASLKRLSL
jgi:hypothetical protein